MIEQGEAHTQLLHSSERVRIELFAQDGQSVFGAIDQRYIAVRGG
jgi:fumarylacetoacetate (FAA) hydrolase